MTKGDRVIIYLPMLPRAHVAMLACARIGAIHSVVFGGFASKELATRIDDAKPKLILTASNAVEPGRIVEYKPLIDAAIDMATWKPEAILVWPRHGAEWPLQDGRDHDWSDLVDAAEGGRQLPGLRADGGGPTHSTFCTRRARLACRRAWCATPVAISSRSPGR